MNEAFSLGLVDIRGINQANNLKKVDQGDLQNQDQTNNTYPTKFCQDNKNDIILVFCQKCKLSVCDLSICDLDNIPEQCPGGCP